jgi:hypothetical protein
VTVAETEAPARRLVAGTASEVRTVPERVAGEPASVVPAGVATGRA